MVLFFAATGVTGDLSQSGDPAACDSSGIPVAYIIVKKREKKMHKEAKPLAVSFPNPPLLEGTGGVEVVCQPDGRKSFASSFLKN